MSEYTSLKEHLQTAKSLQPVNEFLLTLVAGAILCHCLTPALNTEGGKAIAGGIGMLLGGIGSLFGFGPKAAASADKKDDDKKDDDKKDDDKKDDDKKDDDKKDDDKKDDDKKDDDKKDDQSNDQSDDKPVDPNSGDSKSTFKTMLGWCGIGGDKDKEYGKAVAEVLLDKDGNVKDMPFSEEDANKLKEINKSQGRDENTDPKKLLEDAQEAIRKDPSLKEKAINEGHKMTVAKLENDLKQEQEALKKEYDEKMKDKEGDEKKKLEDELKEKLTAAENAHKERVKTQEASRDKMIEAAKNSGDPEKKEEPEGDSKSDDSKSEGDSKSDDSKSEGDSKSDDSKSEGDSKSDDSKSEGDSKSDDSKSDDSKSEEEPEKEVGTVTHNGQETKIIKRPNKREAGKYVYCYANDRDVTVSPDDMKNVKESQYTSLRDYLR